MQVGRTAASLGVTYIGHATVLVEEDGVRLLTDPLLLDWAGFLHRRGAKPNLALCQGVDAAIISHVHRDHFHLPSLRLLDKTTQLIVPRGAAKVLYQQGFEHINEVGVGDMEVNCDQFGADA